MSLIQKDKYKIDVNINELKKIKRGIKIRKECYENSTIFTKILIYISMYILLFIGYINDIIYPVSKVTELNKKGYPPLCDKFLSFYLRHIVHRIIDCWSYPVCSAAGGEIELRDRFRINNRETEFKYTGCRTKCLNLASYNYLGFAEASGACADAAIKAIYTYGISTGSTRKQFGTCRIHNELEDTVAEFLYVEDAIVFGMGFATNTLNIPTLLSSETLVLSDEKNHNSIIIGIKLSAATVKVFKHNDTRHLKYLLDEAICYGQPGQNIFKPWKKIFIFIEGIYSMEGTISRLPEIITLKKKYKAYLYLDEAHSIGALGKYGRGVVDYFNCNPKDIDIWMGTFTKSFGSTGGFIAGRKDFITFLRENSFASRYTWAMSPPLAAQALQSLKILMGKDRSNEGKKRIEKLARNTRYFRKKLQQMGLVVYGNEDSPVVPILVYFFSKIAVLTRLLRDAKIAVIGVGYPATALTEIRIRICLSSAHNKQQLDYALNVINKISDHIGLKYSRKTILFTIVDYDKPKVYYELDKL